MEFLSQLTEFQELLLTVVLNVVTVVAIVHVILKIKYKIKTHKRKYN